MKQWDRGQIREVGGEHKNVDDDKIYDVVGDLDFVKIYVVVEFCVTIYYRT